MPVYHLDFLGPDGRERILYRRNLRASSVRLPLALNDAPGEWTVKVTEIHTGRQQSIKFPWSLGR